MNNEAEEAYNKKLDMLNKSLQKLGLGGNLQKLWMGFWMQHSNLLLKDSNVLNESIQMILILSALKVFAKSTNCRLKDLKTSNDYYVGFATFPVSYL